MFKGQLYAALSWEQTNKNSRIPEVCVHLLATLPSLKVAWTSSTVLQRRTVEWAQAVGDPQILSRSKLGGVGKQE